MDYLIDQAVNDKFNRTLLPYNVISTCKEQPSILWTNVTLETIFREYNLYSPKKGNKVIQNCKNFRCVNPTHLSEVSYEIWFKNGLEAELLWMDYV